MIRRAVETIFEWLVIVACQSALAYALVATLRRITPPPGASPPARSIDH
jgi:hypothetical protein